jgi:hypothetical protein
MQLAHDIVIRLGHDTIHLKPSLRAAIVLERRHSGFPRLVSAVSDGHLGVLADVIRECSDRPSLPDILERISAPGLKHGLDIITLPVLDLVFALAGVDVDKAGKDDEGTDDKRRKKVESITWEDHFRRLFSIATGWLSWPPSVAWDASPAEILAAYEGKLDMLKAVFGGGDEEKPKPELSLYEKANLIFGGMKRTVVELPAQQEISNND